MFQEYDEIHRVELKSYEIEDVGGYLCGSQFTAGGIYFDSSSSKFMFYDETTHSALTINAQPSNTCLEINADTEFTEAIKIVQEGIEWRPVLSRIV